MFSAAKASKRSRALGEREMRSEGESLRESLTSTKLPLCPAFSRYQALTLFFLVLRAGVNNK